MQFYKVFSVRFSLFWISLCCSGLALAQDSPVDSISSGLVTDTSVVRSTFLKDGLNRVYLFSPASFDSTKTYSLTIFLHGYNGIQPELYGGWINSLVEQGSVVIFPVYQNSQVDLPTFYYNHAVEEIHTALVELKQPDYPKVDTSRALYVGHSLGGSMAMKLMNHWDEQGLPKPFSALLAQAGSGMLNIAEEENYDHLPKELLLLCFSGESDLVVGDSFAKKVMKHTPSLGVSNKYWFNILNDKNGKQKLKADHLVPCSYLDILPEKSHLMANSAAPICETNILDTAIYWEVTSILLRMMKHGSTANGFEKELEGLLDVGKWPDGKTMKVLEVAK